MVGVTKGPQTLKRYIKFLAPVVILICWLAQLGIVEKLREFLAK